MIKSPETNNARDMSPKETVDTFVITDDYLQLAKPRNTIVLGSRGSGKTQLLHMLSYDLMRRLSRDDFDELPGKNELIGIYVAFSSFWVRDVNSKSWKEKEDFLHSFKWRVNLAACDAFVICLEALLEEVVEDEFDRILMASELAGELYKAWFFADNPQVDSLDSLRECISRYDNERQSREQTLLAREARSGEHGMAPAIFDVSLFSPIKTARDIVERQLPQLGQPNWVICLDEADFLDEPYQRAINTCMRSRSERLFVKMSTLPFGHYIQDTETPVSIDSGHDFDYLYIDHEAYAPDSNRERQEFAFNLIKKHFIDRSEVLADHSSLKSLFGDSVILNPKSIPLSDAEFDKALEEFATDKTKHRANRLKEMGREAQYKDTIVRKMRGALWLKKQRGQRKGNHKPPVYFGTEVFLRCTDGNPRRMLELSKRLFENSEEAKFPLQKEIQNKVMIDYSGIVLERCRTEEGIGHELYIFMKNLMGALDERFNGKISTDTVYSFEIKNDCDERIKSLIKRAVNLGLIYPNKREAILQNFICEGEFHPAYILAPSYYLLPRQGSSANISRLMSGEKDKEVNRVNSINDSGQKALFEV